MSIEGSEAGGGEGSDLSESAALRETRATYMPAAGEVPDWEKEEAALAFLDEEDVSIMLVVDFCGCVYEAFPRCSPIHAPPPPPP